MSLESASSPGRSSSSAYSDRLSPYPNKGLCGDPEYEEDFESEDYLRKLEQLTQWVKEAKHLVFFTGAGISTACGIPDFRGPNGVWTRETASRGLRTRDTAVTPSATEGADITVSFSEALPSFSHSAIAELVGREKAKAVVTQNVDGLHWKSGVPRSLLSEIHGCLLASYCDSCLTEFRHLDDVGGCGHRPLPGGLLCPKCERSNTRTSLRRPVRTVRREGHRRDCVLRDCVLDWNEELPEPDRSRAIRHCKLADLCIVVGSSLRIEPASSFPFYAQWINKRMKKFERGRVVIINLQKTEYDHRCDLRFFTRSDRVFRDLFQQLDIAIDARPLVKPNLLTDPALYDSYGRARGGDQLAGKRIRIT